MNVKQIVIDYLKAHGCDGLCTSYCSCRLNNWFAFCVDIPGNCVPARLNKETGDYEPVEIEPVKQKTCKWEILSDTKEGVSCRRSCTKSYTARPFMPKYCDDCGKLIEVIGGKK